MLFEYQTQRLILKILAPENAPLVLDFYLRDRELFERYETERSTDFYTLPYQRKVLSYEYSTALKMQTIRFYVFLKENPSQIIGTVCFHGITRAFYQTCEIGYKFSSAFHGHGYACEAISFCLCLAFDDLNLHRVTALVCQGNYPSVRLLEGLGFHLDGICRDYLYLNGKWQDHALYSLLCTDSMP